LNAYKSIFQAVAAGATLFTVNRRLARTLLDGYALYQKGCGTTVWKRPDVLTLDTWLSCRLADVGQEGNLLNPAQSDCLWQQVVRADLLKQKLDLMQIQATTRLVAQAHRLVVDAQCLNHLSHYQVAALLSPEHHAFSRWQSAYLHRCQQQGWIDGAALTDHVITLLDQGRVTAPTLAVFIGFDEFTGCQQRLQDQFIKLGCRVEVEAPRPSQNIKIERFSGQDEREELTVAACWARQQLERGAKRVAVVVPELARLQNTVERIFRRELARSLFPERVPVQSFNVSLGRPLAKQGMVATALTVLSVGYSVDFETLSYLLRSPWLAGGTTEANSRAQLESWLRRQNIREITLSSLIKVCRKQGDGNHLFVQFLTLLDNDNKKSRNQSLVKWGDQFNQLLNQLGWPGDRSLTSDDYQALSAWRDKLVPALAALNVVHGDTNRTTALTMLRKLATEQLFQPKAQDDRLHVTGILETAGLHFDAIWVTGLTDQILPGRVQHNPFIPTVVQRHFQMPHSSIEHEHHYAQVTIDRLSCSASQVVLSHPAGDGVVSFPPSPFIPANIHCLTSQQQDEITALEGDDQGAEITLESLCDEVGCELVLGDHPYEVAGGTSVLKDQALCPFRAYAHHQLKVRALETPQTGIDNRVRGDLIHKVCERFWTEVTTHRQLCAMTDDELLQCIKQLTDEVLDQARLNDQAKELLSIERTRLTTLLFEWISCFERQRQPFTVVAVEQRQQVQVGPLLLTAVPDRVDCLDGQSGCVVIDYKSGMVKNSDLIGETLLEPQLPIYALKGLDQHQQQIVAVVFAQIRSGECAFKGVAADDDVMPRVKSVAKSAAVKRGIDDWPTLLDDWDRQLDQLAHDFSNAQAKVNPVAKSACQFCDLARLCRIAECEESC
jgi:probable DNA repair protein